MAAVGSEPPIPDKSAPGQAQLIVVCAVFTGLSTIAVILRFLSRRISGSISWDDWFTLGSLVFAHAYFINVVLLVVIARAGYHMASYTQAQLELFFKLEFVLVILYDSGICLCKIALLLLCRRIFNTRNFNNWVNAFCVSVVGFWFISIICLTFSTWPIHAQWKYWIPHRTINQQALWTGTGIIYIFMDVAILLLPQHLIWNLKLAPRRKVLVSLLMLMGIFTCLASVLKLIYVKKINYHDITHTIKGIHLWMAIELYMAIICGCATTFPHLYKHWFGNTSVSLIFFTTSSAWLRSLRRGRQSSDSTLVTVPSVTSETPSGEGSIRLKNKEGKYCVHVRTDIDIVRSDRSDDGNHAPRYSWQ